MFKTKNTLITICRVNLFFYSYLILLFLLSSCAGIGTTKPNNPFQGDYPVSFYQLNASNPLLADEIAKLPEMQDGITEKEIVTINKLVQFYSLNENKFNSIFEKIYLIGQPEVRKFCTPLQALFWLFEDGKITKIEDLMEDYTLHYLLNLAWDFATEFKIETFTTPEQQSEIFLSLFDMNILGSAKTQESAKEPLVLVYNNTPKAIPDIHRKKLENDPAYTKAKKEYKVNLKRWSDYKTIIDRLNAPEILDYYIDKNIHYSFTIPAYHRSIRTVITSKTGDCDDLAWFGKIVLSRSGYHVFGRIVGNDNKCHIGLGVTLEDGTYLLAVDFNGRNSMSGPYRSILEVDEALGYGSAYKARGAFNFNWHSR